MPTPGLTDIYEFSDWLKKNYMGDKRNVIQIVPMPGGLIYVTGHDTPRSADPGPSTKEFIETVSLPWEERRARELRIEAGLPEPSSEVRTFFTAPLLVTDETIPPAAARAAAQRAAETVWPDLMASAAVPPPPLGDALDAYNPTAQSARGAELSRNLTRPYSQTPLPPPAADQRVRILGTPMASETFLKSCAARAVLQPVKPLSSRALAASGFLDVDCTRCFEAHPGATPFNRPFIVCPTCGNKRCPKATFHELVCTNSNEPGQAGSDYQ